MKIRVRVRRTKSCDEETSSKFHDSLRSVGTDATTPLETSMTSLHLSCTDLDLNKSFVRPSCEYEDIVNNSSSKSLGCKSSPKRIRAKMSVGEFMALQKKQADLCKNSSSRSLSSAFKKRESSRAQRRPSGSSSRDAGQTADELISAYEAITNDNDRDEKKTDKPRRRRMQRTKSGNWRTVEDIVDAYEQIVGES